MKIHCMACECAGSTLNSMDFEQRGPGEHEILIEISHCGICHSDLHLMDNDWGISSYPLVPGHEIIGYLKEKGSGVTALNIGQRVGVGWQRSACLACPDCLNGDENLCSKQQATCVGHHGGFATHILIDSRFCFPIPDTLDSAKTAPLLCGGVTVFSPMKRFNLGPGKKVGVIGIGGLGHMAIQFARALGCEVTAFSSSPGKEAEARELGAHHFASSRDEEAIAKAPLQDFILSTVFASLPVPAYLQRLGSNGVFCFVGIPDKPLTLPVFHLLGGQKTITASVIGGRETIREMLELSAREKIGAKIESFSLKDANQAIEKLRANQLRYRAVLEL